MFGREPHLPIDLRLGLSPEIDGPVSHRRYAQKLKDRLQKAHHLAAEKAEKRAAANKRRYDAKVREFLIKPGDWVFVKNVRLRGNRKLANRWEDDAYLVIEQCSEDSPVFKVRPETGEGPERTLHRNMLLPCRYTPGPDLPHQPPPQEGPAKRTRHQAKLTNPLTSQPAYGLQSAVESESEEEGEYYLTSVIPQHSVTDEESLSDAPIHEEAVIVPPDLVAEDAEEEPNTDNDNHNIDFGDGLTDGNDVETPNEEGEHEPGNDNVSPWSPNESPQQVSAPLRRSNRHAMQLKRLSYINPGQQAPWSQQMRVRPKPCLSISFHIMPQKAKDLRFDTKSVDAEEQVARAEIEEQVEEVVVEEQVVEVVGVEVHAARAQRQVVGAEMQVVVAAEVEEQLVGAAGADEVVVGAVGVEARIPHVAPERENHIAGDQGQ